MSESPRLPFRVIAASTLLALIAAVFTYVLLSGDDDSDDTDSTIATIDLQPASDGVTFNTFDGEQVPFESLAGMPTLVNFFASDCTPCIKEMPALEEVHQELGDQVAFLGLAAMYDRPEDALGLVERTGVTYPTAHDKESAVATALKVTVLPTTVLLDEDGEVVATHHGEIKAQELRDLIEESFGVTLGPAGS